MINQRKECGKYMSVFLNKIAEIRSALNAELYNCALAVSLTLPDICGKTAFPKEQSSTKRYKDWFSIYAEPLFTSPAPRLPEKELVDVTWITSEECWALRCAVLHAGNYETERINPMDIKIHAHKRGNRNYSHMLRDSQSADWDCILLCETLCAAAEQYYNSVEDKSIFDVNEVRIDTW